jgi:hypothetical protein
MPVHSSFGLHASDRTSSITTLCHDAHSQAVQVRSFESIWNLATPHIDVYVDIEDYHIEAFFDIEYSNLDIDVTIFDIVVTKKTSISTKRQYRRNVNIDVWTSISGSEIEALRYRSVGTSISV